MKPLVFLTEDPQLALLQAMRAIEATELFVGLVGVNHLTPSSTGSLQVGGKSPAANPAASPSAYSPKAEKSAATSVAVAAFIANGRGRWGDGPNVGGIGNGLGWDLVLQQNGPAPLVPSGSLSILYVECLLCRQLGVFRQPCRFTGPS